MSSSEVRGGTCPPLFPTAVRGRGSPPRTGRTGQGRKSTQKMGRSPASRRGFSDEPIDTRGHPCWGTHPKLVTSETRVLCLRHVAGVLGRADGAWHEVILEGYGKKEVHVFSIGNIKCHATWFQTLHSECAVQKNQPIRMKAKQQLHASTWDGETSNHTETLSPWLGSSGRNNGKRGDV